MKKTLFTTTLTLLGFISYSQDKIITHTQDTISCKVIKNQESSIEYRFENEEVINSISKNMVNKIIFSSGRELLISEKVTINGEKDWEKVQITNVESEVAGLFKVGQISAKANSGGMPKNVGKIKDKAMVELKKEAAKKGAHIILVLTESSKEGGWGYGGGGSKASITGIAYSYSKK